MNILSDILFLYLLEATLCISIFYILYRHLFHRQIFFQWNRLYFISIAVISLIIPVIHIPVSLIARKIGFTSNELVIFNPHSNESLLWVKLTPEFESAINKEPVNKYFNFSNIFLVIYLSGIFRFGLSFIINLLSVGKLVKKGKKQQYGDFYIIESETSIEAFSFLRYIFVNKEYKKLSEQEKEQVLAHEIVHAQQLHTLDIIFLELIGIVFWFNPLIRHLKNDVREVHEYIADAVVVGMKDYRDYSRLILKLSVRRMNMVLSSCFSHFRTIDRVRMLASPESDRLRKTRFLIALPLLILILSIFGLIKDFIEPHRVIPETTNNLMFPVQSEFQIVQQFYLDKKLNEVYPQKNWDKTTEHYRISHPELTMVAGSYIPLFAVANGTVTGIKNIDNWGVEEIEISISHDNNLCSRYKGLYKAKIKTGEKILKGDTIGITGDGRLYPAINFQLLFKGKPINPMDCFNKN